MRHSRKLVLLSFVYALLWLQLATFVGLNLVQYDTQLANCVEQSDLPNDHSSDCEDNSIEAEESEIKLLPLSTLHFFSNFTTAVQTSASEKVTSYCFSHYSLTTKDILTPPPQPQL
jgi:hypothetical protein